jgi:uncharacterized OB-fold protein
MARIVRAIGALQTARTKSPARLASRRKSMVKTFDEKSVHDLPPWIADRAGRLVLVGSQDLQSGKCVFPRIPENSPSAPRFAAIDLSRRGLLYSFTVIHPNPKTGEEPFVLAYVDFPEGARAFGRLDLQPGARAEIDMVVEVHIEKSAGTSTRYRFIPASEQHDG